MFIMNVDWENECMYALWHSQTINSMNWACQNSRERNVTSSSAAQIKALLLIQNLSNIASLRVYRSDDKLTLLTVGIRSSNYWPIFANDHDIQSVLNSPVAWSFLMGSTMAKKRSAERAVRVKTDTPMEMSLAHSDTLHSIRPNGQESSTYTVKVNGTHVSITCVAHTHSFNRTVMRALSKIQKLLALAFSPTSVSEGDFIDTCSSV